MSERITVTLHELVAELDIYADARLRERHGVGFNLFELLATLDEIAPVDITTLARCLRVTKAAVSKRVPALVAEGWITTTNGTGRRVVLDLTPRGSELVREAGGELEREFAEMVDAAAAPDDPDAIDPAVLNAQLARLTAVVIARGGAR